MDNSFILSFDHNGKQYNLEAIFIRIGFIHQFHVQLNGDTLIIEFDEERNYRVIDPGTSKKIDLDADFLKTLVNKVSSFH